MSITTQLLSDGITWLVNDDVALRSWTTNMTQNSEALRQSESELTRSQQRESDYSATAAYFQQSLDDITGGTLLPQPNTTPPQYLQEYPTNTFFVATEAQITQRRDTQTANADYMELNEIPQIQADIATYEEVASQIDTPPTGGSEFVYDWDIPTPLEIPAQPVINVDGALQMTVDVTLEAEIKYVEVTFNTDHPSSALEPLVGGIKFNGMVRQMWAQDFLSSNDTATFGSSYFNGLPAGGEWIVYFINDATTETNLLNSLSIRVFY